MKNKTFLALLAILIIAGSMTAVFAASATVGSHNFEIPSDYQQKDTNDTSVVLTAGDRQIIITTEIVGNDTVNSYMQSKGFSYSQSTDGHVVVTGNSMSGEFNYTANTYTKDHGYAIAYFLVRDNVEITIIGINTNFDSTFDDSDDDLDTAVGDIAKEIMLK